MQRDTKELNTLRSGNLCFSRVKTGHIVSVVSGFCDWASSTRGTAIRRGTTDYPCGQPPLPCGVCPSLARYVEETPTMSLVSIPIPEDLEQILKAVLVLCHVETIG
jgi:hypothetical protein